eukprot:scaffold1468_cov206-Alexandrium_tamarense.AAC.2
MHWMDFRRNSAISSWLVYAFVVGEHFTLNGIVAVGIFGIGIIIVNDQVDEVAAAFLVDTLIAMHFAMELVVEVDAPSPSDDEFNSTSASVLTASTQIRTSSHPFIHFTLIRRIIG